MTRRDRRALCRYIRYVANQLGLRDWELRLLEDPADEGNAAQIECIYGRKVARIKLAPDFRDEPADDQRATIIHELIHCHFHPMVDLADTLEQHLGQAAYRAWDPAFRQAMEYAVDGMAVEWARHLPLIGWPVEKTA